MRVINLNGLSVLFNCLIRASLLCIVWFTLESCNPGEPGKLPILGFKDAVKNKDNPGQVDTVYHSRFQLCKPGQRNGYQQYF